jgi:hypothetical protein
MPAPARIKARELCPRPGDMFWDTLQNALEGGWRLAGIHGLGSDGVRRFMQMVDMAKQNRGMTDQDIRDLRLTVEHGTVIGKLPDVMANLKRLGIIISAGPPRLLRYPDFLADYELNASSNLQRGDSIPGDRPEGRQVVHGAVFDAAGAVVFHDEKRPRSS